MREIRNSDGRLVCLVDEHTGAVEISVKGCVTLIKRNILGEISIINKNQSEIRTEGKNG